MSSSALVGGRRHLIAVRAKEWKHVDRLIAFVVGAVVVACKWLRYFVQESWWDALAITHDFAMAIFFGFAVVVAQLVAVRLM